MLTVGDPAPDFDLPADDGQRYQLSALRGQPVVLYFYPKDNTPGCTTEACDFRDNLARLTRAGVTVLGVSKDSLASHAKFRAKHDLNFPLLSDEDTQVHQAYDAWGEKKLYGKTHIGTIRSTFIIDPTGNIAHMWRNLRVKGHVDRVLTTLDKLQASWS